MMLYDHLWTIHLSVFGLSHHVSTKYDHMTLFTNIICHVANLHISNLHYFPKTTCYTNHLLSLFSLPQEYYKHKKAKDGSRYWGDIAHTEWRVICYLLGTFWQREGPLPRESQDILVIPERIWFINLCKTIFPLHISGRSNRISPVSVGLWDICFAPL